MEGDPLRGVLNQYFLVIEGYLVVKELSIIAWIRVGLPLVRPEPGVNIMVNLVDGKEGLPLWRGRNHLAERGFDEGMSLSMLLLGH